MNPQPNGSHEEQFSSLLAACQEALASGEASSVLEEVKDSPELRARLERGVACLQRLQGLRRRPRSASRPLAEGPVPEPGPRYSRTRLHAAGGIGQVWLARDAAFGRDIALKELRPERADNPTLEARFLREARITGQLQHPGIVPVYELAVHPDDGQSYYTMRFIQGRTLTEAAKAYHEKRMAGKVSLLDLSLPCSTPL